MGTSLHKAFPVWMACCALAWSSNGWAGEAAISGESTADEAVVANHQSETTSSGGEQHAKEAKPDHLMWEVPYDGRRFAIDLSLGFAAATSSVYGLELEPYRLSLGGMFSYTLPVGLWFGAYGEVYTGSAIEQVYRPPLSTVEIEMLADTQAMSFGAAIGYDQKLGPIVLRYGLGVGATLMEWDFGDLPYVAIAGFTPMQGSLTGLHLRPDFGVIFPVSFWYAGLDVYYRLELNEQVPPAFGTRLHTGVRF